ncbi:hypothetical protein PSI23_18805 [Xenorhabdus sp. XENO-10]|uniref:Uncharacterized protein n=1 Tax=Xenorhabdus yunnanensis TaxID=3025878 RepID=A0ABT5LJI6_9GAMM|nr:hypothetical protein [Xenorhabdus yunnanensis]MDC9591280.1 hypothetical protein [Xenorhabdus yunnanensis]
MKIKKENYIEEAISNVHTKYDITQKNEKFVYEILISILNFVEYCVDEKEEITKKEGYWQGYFNSLLIQHHISGSDDALIHQVENYIENSIDKLCRYADECYVQILRRILIKPLSMGWDATYENLKIVPLSHSGKDLKESEINNYKDIGCYLIRNVPKSKKQMKKNIISFKFKKDAKKIISLYRSQIKENKKSNKFVT